MNDFKEAGQHSAALKTRRLVFEKALTLDEAKSLAAVLESMDVSPRVVAFEVSYDLAKTDLEGIENLLEAEGVRLESGLMARLRRAWLRYVEENEISNLNAPRKSGACCNRPPVP